MQYRRLTLDELKELEPEFVRFLASNQVPADEWESIKQQQPVRAEQLIELFSDIVFDKVLEKVDYLEYRSPQDLKAFYFTEERVFMNGLRIAGETSLDLTQEQSPAQILQQLKRSGAKLKLYSADKDYRQRSRKMEAFALMEAGAKIDHKGELYRILDGLK